MSYAGVIAKANNSQVVYYELFGAYQGEWILVTKKDGMFYIYKDWYGSCSGCDALHGFELSMCRKNDSWSYEPTDEEWSKFASDYKPFAEIPEEAMEMLLGTNTLRAAMPAGLELGLSNNYKDIPEDEAWQILTDGIKKAITEGGNNE